MLQVVMEMTTDFASQLRTWRQKRGLSQLGLAHEANVSQRHISFLERRRSAPSRQMVLRLGAALEMPLREQNAMLLAAGYAPVWRQSALGTADMAIVDRALDFMLEQHEPFPAFVIDRWWHLLRANRGGQRFAGFLVGSPPFVPDPADPINLADAFVAPQPMRPIFTNWPDIVRYFLRTVRADALADGTAETRALFDRLLDYPDARSLLEEAPTDGRPDPVLAMDIEKDGIRMSLFTTLATLGTPLDVTAQEIRIECFFPAEETTAAIFRDWSATDGNAGP
jgi:transcriptional regulator with XRE-family HTH domain